jgi:hypothetical protein
MPPPQPPEKEIPSKFFDLPWFWWVAICGLSSAVTMPIRYGEGLYGVGRNGFFAVLVIFLYALFAPCPALMTYGLVFMAIAVVKRGTTLFRHHFGNRQISGFEGWPLPCLIGLPCGFCRQLLEPGLIWLLGSHLRQTNPALGCFFIAGAIAAAIKTLFESVVQVNRDMTASDLRIQMELDARRRAKRGW